MNALVWLLGSKAGRITVLVLLAMATVGVVVLQAFQRGRAAESLKQTKARIDALQHRVKSDDAIIKMAPDDRRRELSRWMRDG